MSRVLLICGSLNQTTMTHAVGKVLSARHDCAYAPYWVDGALRRLKSTGLLDRTVAGGQFRRMTDGYLRDHGLPIAEEGRGGPWDLVLTCSDLVVQKGIRSRPIVLLQEGMTDPENLAFHLVRALGLPRWLASTSTTGLSGAYRRFCVASEGYRRLFERKGAPADRLVVTGIPNFDDCASYLANDLPHRGHVLVATSDGRETFKRDDRRAFLRKAVAVAAGRPLLFKLHPNESWERARREIADEAPGALVLTEGNTNHMVANASAVVTQWSSVVFVGLALGKECHSYFDLDELKRLLPLQNGGTSARTIAAVCEEVLAQAAPGAARRAA